MILFIHPQNLLFSRIQNKLLPNSLRWQTVHNWNVHLQSVVNSITQINLYWVAVRSGKNTEQHIWLIAMKILAVAQRKLGHICNLIHKYQIQLKVVLLGVNKNYQMEDVNTVNTNKNARSRLLHHLQLSILFIMTITIGIHMLFKNHLRRTWKTILQTSLAQMVI